MSLLDKMLKSGSTKNTTLLSKSDFFGGDESNIVPIGIPILNTAFSGEIDGGLTPGLTVVAGASKTFKTMISLLCMKAFLDKYDDGIALLYDSEFGITPEYIESFGIDTERVVHIPIENIEILKFDLVGKLQEIDKKDNVFIMIDSVGNLASKKEVEDAENEKSVADMTRAKSLKSLFRIITPHLTMKKIPCLAINHIYLEQGLYPKAIVSGGCLDGSTEIIMSDGSTKKIQDIDAGESVLTLEGGREVTHTWDPDTLEEGTPECYEIKFDDGSSVICSDSHRFMNMNGEWEEVSLLNVGDVLGQETKKITSIKKIGKRPVYDITVSDVAHYILKNGLVSHNTGVMYSANQVFIITKSQEKDGTDLAGYKFTINIEKSRYVREKAKLPFTVLYETGIRKWSGMFDLALEFGYVVKANQGWYNKVDFETGEVIEPKCRAKDIDNDDEFFEALVKDSAFKKFIEKKYKLGAPLLDQGEHQEPEE